MRLHNLTDVSTQVLQNTGLVNVPIKTGGVVIKPGESADFTVIPADASRFLKLGALFSGAEPPDSYLKVKTAPAPKEAVAVVDKVKVEAPVSVAVADTDRPPRRRRDPERGPENPGNE